MSRSCGQIIFSEQAITGFIKTRLLTERFRLVQNPRNTVNSPKFRILADDGCHIGDVWEKTTDKGEVFYSVTFDEPSMAKPLHVSAFAMPDKPESYQLVWSRPRQAA